MHAHISCKTKIKTEKENVSCFIRSYDVTYMCVSFSLMYTFEVGRISQWSRGLCNVFTCHTSVARHISFDTVVQSKQILVWMRLIVCFEMPKISPEILIIYFFCCYFSEQCLVLFINKQVLRMFSFSSTDQILSTLSKFAKPRVLLFFLVCILCFYRDKTSSSRYCML